MLKARTTRKFRKEYALMERRHKDMAKPGEIMTLIGGGQPLPHYEDHPLSGNYAGKRECHVEPNWLLTLPD
jgi:mRNA interferase YafQ